MQLNKWTTMKNRCSVQHKSIRNIYTTIVRTVSVIGSFLWGKLSWRRGRPEAAFFLHSISSLFHQAQRNLDGDNLNVLEYFERRLDDHAYFIRSVILHYEKENASEDFR